MDFDWINQLVNAEPAPLKKAAGAEQFSESQPAAPIDFSFVKQLRESSSEPEAPEEPAAEAETVQADNFLPQLKAQQIHAAAADNQTQPKETGANSLESLRNKVSLFDSICKKHQSLIKAAGSEREALVLGAKNGDTAEQLLYRACRCISLMASDEPFMKAMQREYKNSTGKELKP